MKKVETSEENTRVVKAAQKFELIHKLVKQESFKHLISYLCDCCGVSRSGYYRYFSETAKLSRKKRQAKDEERLSNIIQAIKFRRRKTKGIQQVTMVLHNEMGLNYNHKSVHRIMKENNLLSKVRKANPYKRMAKATKEHRVYPNLVKRDFKRQKPSHVLLTDITYLKYGNNQIGYLSTILDASTNEVVAYEVSDNLKIDFVLKTLKNLESNSDVKLSKDTIIHSDQGAHYTSPQFCTAVKGLNIKQSMSRRGNCWDNAPQESFFGHLKDETNIKEQQTFEDLKYEIDDYIDYYNNYRYQWKLKKMTPVQYRNHLKSA